VLGGEALVDRRRHGGHPVVQLGVDVVAVGFDRRPKQTSR